METEYLAKFDASGRRETTVVSGVHYSTDEERQSTLTMDIFLSQTMIISTMLVIVAQATTALAIGALKE